jgi:hypothetical protein
MVHATYKCCPPKRQIFIKFTPMGTTTFSNMEHHNNVRDFLSAHLPIPEIWSDIEEVRNINPNPLTKIH